MIRSLIGAAVAIGSIVLTAAAESSDGIDAKTTEILRKVGALYKDAKSLHADVVIVGTVAEDGEDKRDYKLKGTVDYKRPNMFAIRTMDEKDPAAGIEYVTDGKEASVFSRKLKQYVQRKAPGTLAEVGRAIFPLTQQNTGFLFQNVLAEDPADQLLEDVTEGKHAGTVKVGDKEAHHLVFKQPNMAWELWIAADGQPFVLKGKSELEQPDGKVTSTETYTNWKLNPESEKDPFVFKVPEGAKKVERIGRDNDDGN